MLMHLHVKNFALIEEADMEFGEGLNILTGETGAGKSILIDAVNLALGGKSSPHVIREGADYAYIELVFQIDDKKDILSDMDIEDEDGVIIISRKIQKNRSIFKINDVTVTAAKVRKLTGFLIDIHGQHEHQSLMYKYKHLEILDAYAGQGILDVKKMLYKAYDEYIEINKRLQSFSLEEEVRLREVDFLKYEINEIESAALKPGEEEELEQIYKKISNSRNIMDSLSVVKACLGYDSKESAGEAVSVALREINSALRYDDSIASIASQIQDMESILSDINHDISLYMEDMVFDEETYNEVCERLDLIRTLQAKYGKKYEQIQENLESKKSRLAELINYEENKIKTEKECKSAKAKVLSLCKQLSEIRKASSSMLVKDISESLKELNFLQVSFDMNFERAASFGSNGYDDVEFVLSANPGQPMRPLGEVASGGELSRIMLAIKSVLADTDKIPSLIFDEIDTGISGRTAACVSEKLSLIGKKHQVLCITHLPQIASMADHHFMISKDIIDKKACTTINHLNEEESVYELARLLGGVQITDAVLENARELKSFVRNQ